LFGASCNKLSTNLGKVRHLHGLFVVGILVKQVETSGSHGSMSRSFLVKIDVSLKRNNCLCLVQRLSEASCHGKGVRTSTGTHVMILAFKSFSVNSNGTSLSIVALWNSLLDFVVGHLLLASPHAGLYDELLVATVH